MADKPEMWVSPETIYQSRYVQSRGALRRELTKCLRTGRALRQPGRHAGQRKTRIVRDMVNISQRPPEASDRAVPGHWEGDLLIGKRNATAIATLVERSTGYALLVSLPDGYKPEHVAPALTAKIGLLPQYFPKGTDLGSITEAQLDAVADELNDRPRKRLAFAKPIEEISELLLQMSASNRRAATGTGVDPSVALKSRWGHDARHRTHDGCLLREPALPVHGSVRSLRGRCGVLLREVPHLGDPQSGRGAILSRTSCSTARR